MFACTLPFTAWALWQRAGGRFHAWVSLYLVLLSSTLLYHLTGLVDGHRREEPALGLSCFHRRRFSGSTPSFPQAAKFGLVYFKYFTIWPVFEENMCHFVPRKCRRNVARLPSRLMPDVRFFGLSFSETTFTVVFPERA